MLFAAVVTVAESWMGCPSSILVGIESESIVVGTPVMVMLTVARLESCVGTKTKVGEAVIPNVVGVWGVLGEVPSWEG